MSSHVSDSSEQQAAETFLLAALANDLGLNFDDDASLPISISVRPDAIDLSNNVLVEVYARVGELKGAQLHKVKGDILKLVLIERLLDSSWRKILCFGDAAAAAYARGGSWVAEAARVFDIEVVVQPLPSELRENILTAQARQVMVNK